MRRTFLAPHRKRKGVSEVLGALLLIVVVVATVASLSVFLAQAQTNAQNRQAYLTNVADENLKVAYAAFYPNNPAIQWELNAINGSLTHRYYVQMSSPTTPSTVLITKVGTPTITHTENLVNGSHMAKFNDIANGVAAAIDLTTGQINISPAGTWAFAPAAWTNVTITVQNLNTAASGIYQIKVNNNWLSHWKEITQNSSAVLQIGSPTSPAIGVPAKSSVTLNLTLSSFTIEKDSLLTVTILSSAGNFFTVNYSPPVPIAKASTSTENYQVTLRDIVTFDASQSFSTGSTVENYFWQIDVPRVSAGCTSTALATPGHFDSVYVSGQTIEYTPESLFNSTQLMADCIAGPIRATLVVVDGNGLMATSNSLVIPLDRNIAPIGGFSAFKVDTGIGLSPANVTVRVSDIFGRPVAGAVVLIVKTSGNVTEFPASVQTCAGVVTVTCPPGTAVGAVSFPVTWGANSTGSIELELGNLPPVDLSFP